MNRLLVAAASLCLGLAGLANVALAQENVQGITTNADGANVSSTAGVNPTANGGGGTIIYGDINTGPSTVVSPPSVDYTAPPPAPAPAAAPEPVYEAPVSEEPVAEAPLDSAVASDSDLDADNLADSLEWELGLDPGLADSDGDGVADGDELSIYGTDATAWDTDGDGVSDGEELFGSQTDPLVWDDFSTADGAVESVAQQAAAEPQSFKEPAPVERSETLQQGTNEVMTATDGDASTLGAGNASASPGTVTRGGKGSALLGPDGTYRVTDNAPANVSVSGDTDVIAPPADSAPTNSNVPSCSSYGSWYDAQIAYESAGLTDADPALVSSLDPDFDGIACEDGM